MSADALIEIESLSKTYGGLRPLRLARFSLERGERVALLGFDQAAAEVFVNLVTGASLPDTGTVRVLGQVTSGIQDARSWLDSLDRLGLLSDRSVLVDQLSAVQNLGLRYTFELDDLGADVRARVDRLAREVALGETQWGQPVGGLAPLDRLRVRLGCALALEPQVLLAEHPNASLGPGDVASFAADFVRVVSERQVAAIVLTADVTFARAVSERVLTLHAGSGQLRATDGWRRWFS